MFPFGRFDNLLEKGSVVTLIFQPQTGIKTKSIKRKCNPIHADIIFYGLLVTTDAETFFVVFVEMYQKHIPS